MNKIKLFLPSILFLLVSWNQSWGQTHFSVNSSTVALWRFDAHSSGTFTDASPNAFSLSNANNYALTPSPFDSAGIFIAAAPAASGTLTHANAGALTMGATGQMTFEVRLYLTQGQSGAGAQGGWVLGTYDGVSLNIGADGHFQAGGQKVRNGAGYWINEVSVAGIVPLNRWFDLAVAFDNSTGQAYGYIDGAPVQLFSVGTANPITDPYRVSTGAFFVGNNGRDSYQFSGKIDEIRVSNNLVLGAGPSLIVGNPAVAPANLSYSANPAIYTANVAITNNTPTTSTGAPTGYSVSPALPAGLVLSAATGVISGTPTATAAAAGYTVTASNSAGSTMAIVTITVVAPTAPSGLSYSRNPAVYGVGVAGAANVATVTGTSPMTFTVTPVLPAGLVLNASTGTISGMPTAASAATYYTVTATNANGATSVSVSIAVIAAPSELSYSANPAQYVVGTAITSNSPTVTGTITGYTVNQMLPVGLTLNATTGVISGTPTAPVAATNYTVTATNAQGSTTTVVLNITVRLRPSNLSYTVNPALYVVGTAITPNSASIQGTSPFTYSVSPALPTGLALNTTTGTIAGTPTVVRASANYVITATNPAGSTTVTLLLATTTNPSAIFHEGESRMVTLRIAGSSPMVVSLPANARSGRIEILDMRGVKVLERQVELGDGGSSISWDGRANGRAISGGLYFVRMTLLDAKQNRINSAVQRIVFSP